MAVEVVSELLVSKVQQDLDTDGLNIATSSNVGCTTMLSPDFFFIRV